jgi:hypothetical protein
MNDKHYKALEAKHYVLLSTDKKKFMKKINSIIDKHEAKTGEIVGAEFLISGSWFVWNGEILQLTARKSNS